MASVTFDGVTKRYGEVTAVDQLDLHVEDGEFMVLLGPSGCGKSTALRMVAGLEDISGGDLSIGDRVVNSVVPAQRDVAMVFQSYALYPHMTVARNIESPLLSKPTRVDDGAEGEVRKLTKAERQARVDEAVRMLGLADYVQRKPGALSGGQRQRVAVARAVVSRPAVFLMDEPLSNLDAKLRAQTRAELIDLHTRLGTTIVYVTHDQIEAMTMADRVAILADGHLQQVGTPREVYEAPANVFVAGFVGNPPMNTARGPAGGGVVQIGASQLPVADAPAGGEVVVGVRPEHLEVTADGPLRARVHHVEWLGHEAQASVDLVGGPADEVGSPLATGASPGRWVVRLAPGLPAPEPGSEIALTPLDGQVHLFDGATGWRLGLDGPPVTGPGGIGGDGAEPDEPVGVGG
ncbi:MAG TPA: ABC transporter ATP-binding protein [Acidimicrobiales bacterium]|nr:ABC transporter ATP-binding protein [Acidimicrobiales bacterium]